MQRKTVLVTGCSEGGLGYALCVAFAAAGCKVYATARDLGKLRALEGHGCSLLKLDVTDSDARQAAVEQVIAESGRIDVLVNNAGQLAKGFVLDVPISAVKQLLEVNFIAVVAMCQLVTSYMVAQQSGTIINIGSVTSYVFLPQASAYAASKAALRSFSDALRVELAPFGIRVVHAALGFIKTQIFDNLEGRAYEQPESPYQRFAAARRELRRDDLKTGVGSIAPADPVAVAGRLVKLALKEGVLPRSYVDAWLAWPLYLLGCYAPLWLLDFLHSGRLFGTLRY